MSTKTNELNERHDPQKATVSDPLLNKNGRKHSKHVDLEDEPETPDKVLNSFGNSNPFILMIFISMAFVWCLTALPTMIAAFFVGEACPDENNCTSIDKGSLVENFRLVGAKSQLADFSTMAFVFGNMFGASSISRFSDLQGRRPALLISLIGAGIFGIFSAFAPNIYAFIVLRFLQGIFLPGCGITNWVLSYESIPMGLRAYSALVFGLTWVIGYCVLAPMAYFIRNWRYLMVATSAPALIFGLIYLFIIPESFHFLVSRGKSDELKAWIQRANRFAKTPKDLACADRLILLHSTVGAKDKSGKAPKNEFFRELFQRKKLVAFTAIVAYVWTCDSFIYYGLSLISTSLAGDKYLNFALSGLVEIPSYLVSPYCLDRLGRRWFVSLTHFLTMVSFIGVIFIDNTTISLILWLIGKFAIACGYTCIYVYASEIFPTVLRSGCIGICVLLERLGGVMAPTVRSMSLIEPHLPNMFFAVSSGLAALLTLLLPETRGKELPDFALEVADVYDDDEIAAMEEEEQTN